MHFAGAAKDSMYEKESLREALLVALADVTTLTFRAQAFHWNVEGPDFHQYHEFFGEIYNDINDSIDPMAENLLKAGFKAPSSISEIISKTSLECPPCGNDPISMSKMLYKANRATIVSLNKVFDHAEKMNLQGLIDFIGGRIDDHEKWSWQLKSVVGPMMDYIDEIPMRKPLPMVQEMVFQADTKNCPPATQDIELNLKNRKNAIDSAMYGPLNPEEPNDDYWSEIAEEWGVESDEARNQICGNCAMFNISPSMKSCIEEGVGPDRFDLVDAAGELGYCEAFDFKCASARTCRAWVTGGPISDDEPEAVTAAADPCWEGYVMVGMKEQDGKMVPNCVPEGSAAALEFAEKSGASTPAPKKDQIKGSDKNPEGSASGGKKITFSESVEKSLKNKMEEYNEKAPSDRKATLSMLKAVYRRGAGAYSTSHRPGKSRGQWAMARVNAFLKLMSSGKPSNPAYTQDNDLLPSGHPRSSSKESSNYNEYVESQLLVEVKENIREYDSVSDAIIAAVEFSGLGYDSETAFTAAWIRALESNEDPYKRILELAHQGFSSRDADLLPIEEVVDVE